MKLYILALCCIFSILLSEHTYSLETHIFPATVIEVIDGDTLDVEIDMSLGIVFKARLRVKGLDTPETWRPSNNYEKIHGEQAKEYAKKLVADNKNNIIIKVYGWGVYNRVEAEIFLPTTNTSYKDIMVLNGFEKKKQY
jgi:micrococcal nuclease